MQFRDEIIEVGEAAVPTSIPARTLERYYSFYLLCIVKSPGLRVVDVLFRRFIHLIPPRPHNSPVHATASPATLKTDQLLLHLQCT